MLEIISKMYFVHGSPRQSIILDDPPCEQCLYSTNNDEGVARTRETELLGEVE